MNYKLLAVDIDGTLLNSDGILTQNTKESIHKAVERGVIFVICTGRPIQGVTDLNEEIGLDLPYITYNGAMVVMGKSKEILYERSLPKEQSRKIYRLGQHYDVTMVIWGNNQLYTNKINDHSIEYSGLTKTKCIEIQDLDDIPYDITKILWYEDHEELLTCQKELEGQIDNHINMHFSRPYFLEFVDAQATKAIAIEKLCDYYGFGYNQTIAIGDGENDLSMIQSAGLGVAMSNAPEKIRRAAAFVTLSCDEDGVAHVIDKYIMEGNW
ncbi:MAG: Cof-type HAD-IIB family hydrolase [Eubacteriales bacterium]